MTLRVCDSCIRKKVKCDLGRPSCSSCMERGFTCTYTSQRRRPGPPRGWQRASATPRASRLSDQPTDHTSPSASNENRSRTESIAPLTNRVSTEQPSLLSPGTPPGTSSPPSHPAFSVSPQQEEAFLERYFDIVHDANPILDKERFLQDYRRSLCSQDLISAIVLITAKLTGNVQTSDASGLDASIDRLLSSSLLEEEIVGDFPSLDQFRKACILAFYEFHQFPGNQSWMRVGRLTRMAYRIGLDRLEVLRVRYDDWKRVSYEEIQEWRSVWWCIYRLDAYSNLSSGTPFLIEDGLIDVSFVLGKQTSDEVQHPQELFMSREINSLRKLVPAVTAHPETMVPNIHNMTIAAVRQVGLVARLHFLRPREGNALYLATVEQHLSEFRMSLPPGWLNPRRNAFAAESPASHHGRMISLFLLRMAQLVLLILHCGAAQGDEWFTRWQGIYEMCQDIASVAEQWDSSFCLKVDPAICFTTFTALVFLELHRKSAVTNLFNIQSKIDHDKTILYLQLEQFASVWTLPRLLILSFKSFSESVPGPLSNRQIALILSRFEAPLHPRWVQFLSSARDILDAASQCV